MFSKYSNFADFNDTKLFSISSLKGYEIPFWKLVLNATLGHRAWRHNYDHKHNAQILQVKTEALRHVEKTEDRGKIALKMSDTDVSEYQISSDGRQDSSEDESSDYGVVQLGGMEPYQDEPLAANRRRPRPRMAEDGDGDVARWEDEDPDGIAIATLESRYEKRSPVGLW